MIEKHPRAEENVVWPELPPEWYDVANIDTSTRLAAVLRDADTKTSVGPRCFRPDHIKWLFYGHFEHPEAKSAAERFADLGNKYLSCRIPLCHLGVELYVQGFKIKFKLSSPSM